MVLTPLAVLVGETLPQVAPEQPAPETIQVTPMFAGSLETEAVNCAVLATCTDPALEEMDVEIAGVLGGGGPDDGWFPEVFPTVHPEIDARIAIARRDAPTCKVWRKLTFELRP